MGSIVRADTWEMVAIALQGFQLVILLFHDWIPLGSLNDVRAVRQANPGARVLVGTLISSLPPGVAFALSVTHLGRAYPHWLVLTLWCIYGFLFVGELEAWWVPYFFGSSIKRVERYRAMFGSTKAFLPPRNGIIPNTLHCCLHIATLATLIVLTRL
jgi:hypothetical protein